MIGLSKFLIMVSIFLSHLPQLKVPIISTTTRPVFQLFFLPILIGNSNKVKLERRLKMKWFLFSLTFFYYLLLGLILYQNIQVFIRYTLGFIFLSLFYFFGYTKAFLKEKSFYKINIIFFLFISVLGILQILGILFNPLFLSIANNIRTKLLSVVLDKERLTLLFSEPSFLASYILYMLFLVDRMLLLARDSKYFYWTVKVVLLVFAIFSKSLYVYLTISVLLIIQFMLSDFSLKRKFAVLSTLLILSFFMLSQISDRLQRVFYFQDLSFIARYTYIEALVHMFLSSKFFGCGIGGFGYYFSYYLNNQFNLPIFPPELTKYLDGNIHAVPFSLFFQFLGETGLFGTSALLLLIFHGFLKSKYKHYYLAMFVTTLSALPWGLPYFWILLGLLHSIENRRSERK